MLEVVPLLPVPFSTAVTIAPAPATGVEVDDADDDDSMVSGAWTLARRGRVTSGNTTRDITPKASLCPCPDCSRVSSTQKTKRHNTTRNDTTRHETAQHDTKRHNNGSPEDKTREGKRASRAHGTERRGEGGEHEEENNAKNKRHQDGAAVGRRSQTLSKEKIGTVGRQPWEREQLPKRFGKPTKRAERCGGCGALREPLPASPDTATATAVAAEPHHTALSGPQHARLQQQQQ